LADGRLHYDESFPYAQDYALWVRIAQQVRFANLPEVLVQYGRNANSVGVAHHAEQQECAARARRQCLLNMGFGDSARARHSNDGVYPIDNLHNIAGKFIRVSDQRQLFLITFQSGPTFVYSAF